MNTAWFITLGAMLVAYAALDGLDLGIGAIHLLIARSDSERRALLSVIGPFWFGYEVWLIASGGAMVAAFPVLYADSFSGFYLVLTVVLWLLISRGTAIEFRSRVGDPLWRAFWDVVFSLSSAALALFFGAAFANVFQGVPINSQGEFLGTFAQALNPYSILVGVLSIAILSMHGAAYAAYRLENGALRDRALASCRWLLAAVLPLSVIAAVFGLQQRPGALQNFAAMPLLTVVPVLAAVAIGLITAAVLAHRPDRIVVGTTLLIVGLMGSAGISLYPNLLPAVGSHAGGLTIFNAAVPRAGLVSALVADLTSLTAVVAYALYEHRVFRAKIPVSEAEASH